MIDWQDRLEEIDDELADARSAIDRKLEEIVDLTGATDSEGYGRAVRSIRARLITIERKLIPRLRRLETQYDELLDQEDDELDDDEA